MNETDYDVDGRIILTWFVKNGIWGYELDSNDTREVPEIGFVKTLLKMLAA